MGEIIQFKRPDAKTCPGYLATPKTGSSAPGFVVIQEWWGLNDQIKKTADRLAGAGHRRRAGPLPRQGHYGQRRSKPPDDEPQLPRCRRSRHPRRRAAPKIIL